MLIIACMCLSDSAQGTAHNNQSLLMKPCVLVQRTGNKQHVSVDVLPLSVSIHQDPDKDPCDSHQDRVVVDAFQTCNTNTSPHEAARTTFC